MERNTQTTLEMLRTGDRFYRLSGKDKTVWELISCSNRRYNCKRDTDKYTTPFMPSMSVIYLRSKL